MTALINPATEKIIANLPDSTPQEVDDAVAAAHSVHPKWKRVSPSDRARLLRRLATHIEESAEELAVLESQNSGKPIQSARQEIRTAAETFYFYSGSVDKHHGETIPVDGGLDVTLRESLGVVALIVPWNFPLLIASWKIAPALACGNSVVLKPSELTPLTALKLAELALDAGLPEGVLNIVLGPGNSVGRQLVDHPSVVKVSFTGSTRVGKEIMSRVSSTIKRVSLELGGKSANIVFADANIDLAARAAPSAVFDNAGQDCCARSRILVQESVFDEFTEKMVEATAAIRVGNPESLDSQMGPLISEKQRRKVAGYIDEEVIFQGDAPDGPGYWFPCTIMGPVTNSCRAAQEEIFGPVVCLIPFSNESEAIAIANDTEYGLSGSIWTNDASRAIRTAREVQAGALSINSNTSVRVQTPFGGFKQSGFGRELGVHALATYSEIKNVFIASSGQ